MFRCQGGYFVFQLDCDYCPLCECSSRDVVTNALSLLEFSDNVCRLYYPQHVGLKRAYLAR